MNRNTIVFGAASTAWVVVCISSLFLVFAPQEFAQWLATLLATLIGAALAAASGVWLFYYQAERAEEKRVQELREALIAELYATRDRLQIQAEQHVPDPTGEGRPTVRVVLAHVEPTACDEVIRSALFGHANTKSLTYLSRLMREYSKGADLLQTMINRPVMNDPDLSEHIYVRAQNVKGAQQFIVHYCDTILEGFRSQGLELPPEERYYSDPSRRAPEGFVDYEH